MRVDCSLSGGEISSVLLSTWGWFISISLLPFSTTAANTTGPYWLLMNALRIRICTAASCALVFETIVLRRATWLHCRTVFCAPSVSNSLKTQSYNESAIFPYQTAAHGLLRDIWLGVLCWSHRFGLLTLPPPLRPLIQYIPFTFGVDFNAVGLVAVFLWCLRTTSSERLQLIKIESLFAWEQKSTSSSC